MKRRWVIIAVAVLVVVGLLFIAAAPDDPRDTLAHFVGPLPADVVVLEAHEDEPAWNPLYDDSYAWHIRASAASIDALIRQIGATEFDFEHAVPITDMSGNDFWFDPKTLGRPLRYFQAAPNAGPGIEIWIGPDGREAIIYVWFI